MTSANMASKLYFHPERSIGLSNFKQLYATERGSKIGKTAGELRAWYEAQENFTFHRRFRKRLLRNPYIVNNIMDVWVCDLVVVQGLSKYKDGIIYLLIVIDFHFKIPIFRASEMKEVAVSRDRFYRFLKTKIL